MSDIKNTMLSALRLVGTSVTDESGSPARVDGVCLSDGAVCLYLAYTSRLEAGCFFVVPVSMYDPVSCSIAPAG